MYNLTVINCNTTRSRVLLNTNSKSAVLAKMEGYLTRLGLDDNSVINLTRDNTNLSVFYHPKIQAFCVIRLRRIIS